MKNTFRLVESQKSVDTIEALEELLEQAKKGQLIGIAFAAMYERREFIVSATGETLRNPVWARGMVSDLHDWLGEQRR